MHRKTMMNEITCVFYFIFQTKQNFNISAFMFLPNTRQQQKTKENKSIFTYIFISLELFAFCNLLIFPP